MFYNIEGFVAFLKVPVNGREQGLRSGANLQMMFMSRFCNFFQNKTVNDHMQGALGQAGHVKQNLVDGLVPVSGRNLIIMLKF